MPGQLTPSSPSPQGAKSVSNTTELQQWQEDGALDIDASTSNNGEQDEMDLDPANPMSEKAIEKVIGLALWLSEEGDESDDDNEDEGRRAWLR